MSKTETYLAERLVIVRRRLKRKTNDAALLSEEQRIRESIVELRQMRADRQLAHEAIFGALASEPENIFSDYDHACDVSKLLSGVLP